MKVSRKNIIRAGIGLLAALLMICSMPICAFAQGPDMDDAPLPNSEISLTREELEYLRSQDALIAASIDGSAPFSYRDSKGRIKGISINVMEEVSAISGLKFEYMLYEGLKDLINSDFDVLCGMDEKYLFPGITITTPYLHTDTLIFYNSSLDPSELRGKRYAMLTGGTIPQDIAEENVVFFNDREEAFKAVNEGKADYGYANAYSLAYYTLQEGYENISSIPQKQETRAYGIGVKEEDEMLLSILNKSIAVIDDKRMRSLVFAALSDIEKRISLKQVIKEYWPIIASLFVLAIGILSYISRHMYKLNKQLNVEMARVKDQEEKIRQMSIHDSLTGLYNRAYVEDELQKIDTGSQLPISLIVADINGLKIANDAFGHDEGDKLIKMVGEAIKKSCRTEDVIARTGGDEFLVILLRTSEEEVAGVAERIKNQCDDRCQKNTIPASIAVGYATKTEFEEDIYTLRRQAEEMMYRNKQLLSRQTRQRILDHLEESLYKKDGETKDHVRRLIDFTEKLGERLGLSPIEMDELRSFARYHDIGNVTLEDSLLTKKGEFTNQERKEIRKHVEAGYRLAESSQVIGNIANYILHHHEHWNGKGYPHGLKGEEIPLLSRILAIADAYDAMTNDRPNRKAMNTKEAIEELKRSSGKQFDPNLVPVFISII